MHIAYPIIQKLKNCKPFRVDEHCERYPDIVFETISEEKPTTKQIVFSVSSLKRFYYRYNILHFFSPIHYISDIDNLPDGEHPKGIYIHMDFGNCSPSALIKAVGALKNRLTNPQSCFAVKNGAFCKTIRSSSLPDQTIDIVECPIYRKYRLKK